MRLRKIIADILEDNQSIIFYYDATDRNIIDKLDEIYHILHLQEGKTYQLKSPYSVRLDNNNPYPIQDHLHLFCKGNQFLALNKDGTAHDGYSGVIPKKIHKQLSAMFPNFKFPTDRQVINESVGDNVELFKQFIDLALKKITSKN